jgi:hypothetical protein
VCRRQKISDESEVAVLLSGRLPCSFVAVLPTEANDNRRRSPRAFVPNDTMARLPS